MRQGGPNNNRRPRGRHHGGGGGNGGGNGGAGPSTGNINNNNRPRSAASLRHQTFDSNCIDVRVRGNAWQVFEKYQALARDAQSSGDRVAAENYMQHAEHYYRIIEAINEATAAEQPARAPQAPGFEQQPAVPPNYYGGNQTQPTPAGAPVSADPQQPQAQAEVTMRQPPQQQQPSPFFTPEEAAEGSAPGNEPLVANR